MTTNHQELESLRQYAKKHNFNLNGQVTKNGFIGRIIGWLE